MPNADNVEEIDFLPLGSEPGKADTDTSSDNNIEKDKEENTDQNQNSETKDDENIDQNSDNNTNNEEDVNEEVSEQETNEEESLDESNEEEQQEQKSLYKSLVESSGVSFEDQELEDILSTSEDTEGFNKVASKIAEKKTQSQLDDFFNKYPKTAQLLEYEMNGGSPDEYFDTYFPENDYSEAEVSEDDVAQQKQIVRKSLEQQGYDQEDIDSQIDDFENAGILENNAKRSLKLLKKKQEQQKQDFEQKQQNLKEQRKQEAQKVYNQTEEFVRNNKIEGINIPKDKQDDFLDYVFEPVNESGNTQAELDSQKLDLDKRLLITYLNFSGYDLDGFINDRANNKKVTNIRDAINKSNSNNKISEKNNYKKTSDKVANIEAF